MKVENIKAEKRQTHLHNHPSVPKNATSSEQGILSMDCCSFIEATTASPTNTLIQLLRRKFITVGLYKRHQHHQVQVTCSSSPCSSPLPRHLPKTQQVIVSITVYRRYFEKSLHTKNK